MLKNAIVDNGTQKLIHLSTELEQGTIKIPRFQRDFVWTVGKSAGLIDSILKGYPIGALIYWRTDERLRSIRDLGRFNYPAANAGEKVNYVLDGQQRLTSIVAALNGLKVKTADEKEHDFSKIYVRLSLKDQEDPFVILEDEIKEVDTEGESLKTIPLSELWHRRGTEYDSCEGKDRTMRDELGDKLRGFDIPRITLKDASLSMATEVFSRINTGGKVLSVFEIMVAKTYAPEVNFDLIEKSEEVEEELYSKGFGKIERSNLIQLVSLILAGECRKSTILNLKKDNFIEEWPQAMKALYAAVDHIRDSLRLPVSKLLPYSSMIIPIALFFRWNDKKSPSKKQTQLLQDFFWRAGWSERYSSSQDSALSQDCKIIKKIIQEKKSRYDWSEKVTHKALKDVWFSPANAFTKTIMALLATINPEKYNTGDLVNLRNDWMLRANSKNYHHVFPKKFLKDQGFENWEANRIVNISLVDDFLNKNVIRARAPSDYMKQFENEHQDFEKTMQTHLIETYYGEDDEVDDAPIWTDDYDAFVKQRSKAIVKKLKSLLV